MAEADDDVAVPEADRVKQDWRREIKKENLLYPPVVLFITLPHFLPSFEVGSAVLLAALARNCFSLSSIFLLVALEARARRSSFLVYGTYFSSLSLFTSVLPLIGST